MPVYSLTVRAAGLRRIAVEVMPRGWWVIGAAVTAAVLANWAYLIANGI